MVRVLVAPRVLNDANEAGLLKELNRLNKGFKSFKYYFDDNGSLVLDCCVLLPGSEADGDLIYTMFDVIIAFKWGIQKTYAAYLAVMVLESLKIIILKNAV